MLSATLVVTVDLGWKYTRKDLLAEYGQCIDALFKDNVFNTFSSFVTATQIQATSKITNATYKSLRRAVCQNLVFVKATVDSLNALKDCKPHNVTCSLYSYNRREDDTYRARYVTLNFPASVTNEKFIKNEVSEVEFKKAIENTLLAPEVAANILPTNIGG